MTSPCHRAVILAAGRGSRMGRLTEDRPKCLLEAGGMSLLDWQLKALRRAGVDRVALVRGYRAELLRRPGLHYFDNPGWERSNSLSSLFSARPWLEETSCLVCYSDIAYHPDTVTDLLARRGNLVVPYDVLWRQLWEERFSAPESDAESLRASNGRLLEIGARGTSLEEIQGQFMGLLKFSPEGWSHIRRLAEELPPERLRAIDITGALSLLLARGVRVVALSVRGRWCEIDSARDLALCRRKLAEGKDWTHDWRS